MKKSLLTVFFLLICFIAMSKSVETPNDFAEADEILITFLHSPGGCMEIDTTIIIKSKHKVKFKGFYNCLADTEWSQHSCVKEILNLEITTDGNRKIDQHYYNVITKGLGIYDFNVYSYYDHSDIIIRIREEKALTNTILFSAFNASKTERTRSIARRDSIDRARRDSIRVTWIRKKINDYDRIYNMQKELNTIKREYVKSNNIKEKYIKKLNSTTELIKYYSNTLKQYDKLRFQEVDALEKQYIGRLEGEIFARNKKILNDKWKHKCEIIENKIEEANASLVKYRLQCVEDFNNYILAKGYNWKFGYIILNYDYETLNNNLGHIFYYIGYPTIGSSSPSYEDFEECSLKYWVNIPNGEHSAWVGRQLYYKPDDKQLIHALLDVNDEEETIGFVELCRLGK